MDTVEKTRQLLSFLKGVATLRRKRIAGYGSTDKVMWFADLPRGLSGRWKDSYRSAFTSDSPEDIADLWLEIRKRRMPERPPVPENLTDWVRPEDLDNPDREPDILPEITLLVEKRLTNPDAVSNEETAAVQKIAEVHRLEDYPEIQNAWLDYLERSWVSWAEEMRQWRELQGIYETVDFMRRRLEEAEERYELVMAVGLVQWRDSTGAVVSRHVLTAPAEIMQDADRGVLTVTPAASFDRFRVELDMLELQDQPRLDPVKEELDQLLEELDVNAWDARQVGKILRVIANRTSSGAQVDENKWNLLQKPNEILQIIYGPALVLRERRPTAYDELVGGFLKKATASSPLPTTDPWELFVAEGEVPPGSGHAVTEDDLEPAELDGRLYFPRDTNEEQKKIALSLKGRTCVLVKGPPGTGKSHTIANLICHLLAIGERVLVTAHAPKALAVLRDLLPGDIPNLSVMAFGSSREDQELLQTSIRTILTRKAEWKGRSWAEEQIAKWEQELSEVEDECARIDRQLRECRESETFPYTLFKVYQGTAAEIARQLEREKELYGWFPQLRDASVLCTLEDNELRFLADVHSSLTVERWNELRLNTGDFELPCPQDFEAAVDRESRADERAHTLCQGIEQQVLKGLERFSISALAECKSFLEVLQQEVVRAARILGDILKEILEDLLAGQASRWQTIVEDVTPLLERMRNACKHLGSTRVEVPASVSPSKALEDAMARLEHFEKGGGRGFWFFVPKALRDTRYIEEVCRVNGRSPRDISSLTLLVKFLELNVLLEQFGEIWPETTRLLNRSDPRRAAQVAEELVQEVNCLLRVFEGRSLDTIAVVPTSERGMLFDVTHVEKWLRLLEAEIARWELEGAREALEKWLREIQNLSGDLHPCMRQLVLAIQARNTADWKAAWETRERLKEQKDSVKRYLEIRRRLEQLCPGLRDVFDATRGIPEWKERIAQMDRAWRWAAAKAWLLKVTNSESYRVLVERRRRLDQRAKELILRLAEIRAWKAFFERLDQSTQQSLIAWQKAINRVGKDTGKYAFKHRRVARKYLIDCVPKIPVWIMPLHKLWETVNSQPGLFDTIIVDEASQAGIESLILLLLAKRIVVVGDDKQNSPEAVGVREEDIGRLARDYLRDFRFQEEFRPDTSLYDHAERAFGNVISLREHFRCVPEIIRFSNDLCYTDAPLIPLRQPPPGRLSPLKAVFVEEGSCEGEGQRLINRAEAERIVRTIRECIENPAYKGKTMGVIVLQGHAQAELIERKLAEILEPRARQERKLRCGVPATFQGDERDVIFLSLVVAPNHPYRALVSLPEQRRFNVAMSRAREQVWLFHSVQQDELSREDLRWRLLNSFCGNEEGPLADVYEELDRLEREMRRSTRRLGEQPPPYESWFEVDVALEFLRRKYRVIPQYEVSGYRIDLVLEGGDRRLAIECDGERWHGAEQYERDVARQRQLERAGWRFVRIRESEFYADRARRIEEIIETYEQLGATAAGYGA